MAMPTTDVHASIHVSDTIRLSERMVDNHGAAVYICDGGSVDNAVHSRACIFIHHKKDIAKIARAVAAFNAVMGENENG